MGSYLRRLALARASGGPSEVRATRRVRGEPERGARSFGLGNPWATRKKAIEGAGTAYSESLLARRLRIVRAKQRR